jgi:DNA-binding Lrp family transcriptional regulator
LPGVESVDQVTGPYDIIVAVTAADLNAVGDLVTDELHVVNGIVRTITSLWVGAT